VELNACSWFLLCSAATCASEFGAGAVGTGRLGIRWAFDELSLEMEGVLIEETNVFIKASWFLLRSAGTLVVMFRSGPIVTGPLEGIREVFRSAL